MLKKRHHTFNNINKVLNSFTIFLNYFVCPAFIFDYDHKVLNINTPLLRIVKRASVKRDMLYTKDVLKINGFNGNYNKVQLRDKKTAILKDEHHNIMYISIKSSDDVYLGGMMIIVKNKAKCPCFRLNSYIVEKGSKKSLKHLVYNGVKYEKMKDVLDVFETEIITEALYKTNNKSEAIELLGLSRRTFYHKLKKIRS